MEREVTREEFFSLLEAANKNGLDPMPTPVGQYPYKSEWKCQRTRRPFGTSQDGGFGKPTKYYVTA